MKADLDALLGGPVGRHAVRSGPWFRPGPWVFWVATLAWVLLLWRQGGCIDHGDEQYKRLCYSDVVSLWGPRGIADARIPYLQADLEYPVLTGGFIYVTRLVSGLIPTGRPDVAFLGVTAVALFGCLLGLLWVHLRLGDRWDALMIAASPLVVANGLVNWDLFVVLLTSAALLAWARRRPALAGVLIGLGTAAKLYPALLLVPLVVLALRAGRLRAASVTAGTSVLAWAAVNLPVYLVAPQGWINFWGFNADRGADLGSFWYVLTTAGWKIDGLSVIVAVLLVLGTAALCVLWLVAPRRPRLAQAALLLLILFVAVNKVYSPQYALWLLPLVVLARPSWVDWAIFTAGELVYFFAIWAYLDGTLYAGNGQPRLYWAATLLRLGVELWIASRVIRDILRPWDDPVRAGYVDDPGGGVLDQAPDAAWLPGRGVRWAA